MADTDKVGTTPKKTSAGSINPESPTTARPLDFDDEPQESGLASAPISSRSSSQLNLANQAAGMQSQRPSNPHQKITEDLREAFPNIDAPVIKAVVVASDGNVERAFNALLGMSDPDAQDDVRPAMPPRPVSGVPTSTAQSQLEDDERYARQLAEHYSGSDRQRGFPQSPWEHGPASGQRGTGLKPNELYDREHSFIDDDLPIIKENIRKGFLETQSRVNTWVENFKKRLDGEESDEDAQHGHRQRQYTNAHNDQGYPNRRSTEHRRSVDRERYDADPHVLGDDFSSLELRDNEVPPPRPPRPQANPDLFKAKSASPDRRKVSFQEGPPEEIQDSYSGSNSRTTSANKSSKWQPLSAVEPSPVADNDPFSLGDSDDEKDTKPKDAKTDEANGKKTTTETTAGKSDQTKDNRASVQDGI
ncbi:CUE domain-containing protein 5 [Arthroderma uncinatum]|uniref:CUE domain-containing protein 5 n=1 Tax=Arthroderma uncinatum TaxID=74035 RepID=UPI00144A5F5B|nr:CUE domain-containing protein 5 [Arthroderma uncinatum]KAF3480279.1 CUE domain-containing protein 5 [Arthroderma uncinatum]